MLSVRWPATQDVAALAIRAGTMAYEKRVPKDHGSPLDLFKALVKASPDPWQADYLTSTNVAPCQRARRALGTSRQAGKSTAVAIRAAWRLVRWTGQEVVVLAKTDLQAKRLSRRIKAAVATRMPKPWPQDNVHEVELPNGNTLLTLPGGNVDGVRGPSPTLLLLDEAAFVPEELIAALSPMLAATQGDWDMLSSANAPAGTFYEAMEGEQRQDWQQLVITADDCPRISREFLDGELRRLGEARYLREFYVRFLAPEGAFFSPDALTLFLDGAEQPRLDHGRVLPRALGDKAGVEDLEDAFDLTRYSDREEDRFLDDR